MGRRSRLVYFIRAGAVFSADIDTGATREIATLPRRGGLSTVNAGETLLAGTYIEGASPDSNRNHPVQPQPLDQPPNKGLMMERTLAARLPRALYTVNIKSGEVKVILRSTDWLNHLPDGKTIWDDLQTPRGEVFWLAGYEVATGRRTWYSLLRNEWSIHFNVTPDAQLFCGYGGDPGQVAHAPDGRWIYLFHPELIRNRDGLIDPSSFNPVSFAPRS